MNKRKAKKKYKWIYEQKLNNALKSGSVCIDFGSPNPKNREVTFIVNDWGNIAEVTIRIDGFEQEPLSEKMYPRISIFGELIKVRAKHDL